MGNRSPIGWALQPLKKYAVFRGRASRAEFWWFALFVALVYFLFWALMVGAVGGMTASQTEPSLGMIGAMGAAGIFMILFWLAVLIPSIAVQVRRLHDTNRSGWWVGGFYLLYALYFLGLMAVVGPAMTAGPGGISDSSAGAGSIMMIMAVLVLAILVYGIVLLVFYVLPGTKGANRYGPDPYGEDIEQVFA